MKYVRINLIIILTTILSACLSPVPTDTPKTYMLNLFPRQVPTRAMHQTTLLILAPDSLPVYNTTQMAYTIKPFQVAYFTQNQWAETPAQMLQPLLVQTLQKTHHFHAVVAAPYAGHYDYVLSTQILELLQDFTHRRPCLHFILRVQLSRASTGEVIAIKDIKIHEPMMQKTPYAGVIAANLAVCNALKDIARFCLNRI